MEALLTIKEAAELLNCSESFLYKAANSRRIPVIRLGRSLRFDKNCLSSLSGEAFSRSSLTTEKFGTAKSKPRKESLWE
jgi:excisionase family DNA binding protein